MVLQDSSPNIDSLANTHNFYTLFSISRNATLAEIKSAYHRVLLISHPDKRIIANDGCRSVAQQDKVGRDVDSIDISLIKEAYTTLSNPDLRALYDVCLSSESSRAKSNATSPRPAQVVSLEDFQQDTQEQNFATGQGSDGEEGPWRYPCRCTGWYRISTSLMEQGIHLIGCCSCSEVIWVGYEQVDVEV